jgi:hypothetical protein
MQIKENRSKKPEAGEQIKTAVYFYPWYNEQRWKEAPRKHTPSIGEYHSDDPSVIAWQFDLINYCGFDYVIFELVPESDWCFKTVERSIELAVEKMRSLGMKWSFLIDTKLCPPNSLPEQKSELEKLRPMIDSITENGWSDGLIREPEKLPLLFIFAPVPSDTLAIQEHYGSAYEFRYPAYFPHWDHVDGALDLPELEPFTTGPRAEKKTLFDYLTPLNYISFWESTLDVSNFRGFCSVVPEYDDSLLKRKPQLAVGLERSGGDTFIQQFRNALSTKPDQIIVYSWNEYFESSTIEPTEEYGRLFVDTARKLIAETRPGKDSNGINTSVRK